MSEGLSPRRGDRLGPGTDVVGAVASAIKGGAEAEAGCASLSPLGCIVGADSPDGDEFGAAGKNFAPGFHSADPHRRGWEELDVGGAGFDCGQRFGRGRCTRVWGEPKLECGRDDVAVGVGGDDDAGTGLVAFVDLVGGEHRAGRTLVSWSPVTERLACEQAAPIGDGDPIDYECQTRVP